MLLSDKRILVTGVLNDASIAFSVAKRAQEEGAEVVLTSFGRAMSLTQRAARRLADRARRRRARRDRSPKHLDALAERVGGRLDGVLHAIGFAPESCLGGGFLTAPWEDVSVALQISAYSLKSLAVACRPMMQRGGSIVGLDFDNSRVAWPVYDWMGVAKAAFESTARYLARDLGPDGIRVNLVAAGPMRTIAAKSIPGFEQFEDACGPSARRSVGTSRTPRRSRARVRRAASPTCSRRRRARSSTSTAATTPSARSCGYPARRWRGSPLREDRDEGLDPRRLAPAGELVPHRFLDDVRRLVRAISRAAPT